MSQPQWHWDLCSGYPLLVVTVSVGLVSAAAAAAAAVAVAVVDDVVDVVAVVVVGSDGIAA